MDPELVKQDENPSIHEPSDESKPKDDDENAEHDIIVQEETVKSSTPEDELLKLEILSKSDFIRDRQLAAKSIVGYLHQAGSDKEAVYSVIFVMCKLSEDEDSSVRWELIDNIPSIVRFLLEQKHLDVIRLQIVPYAVQLLSYNQIQVRKIGHTILIVLLENDALDKSQLSEWICPLIVQLATCEDNPHEIRLEDVSLMCKMIPYVGKDMIEKFYLEPFLSICCDSTSAVREVCVVNLVNVGKVIGREETEEKLLPVFLNLCSGESWKIKCICVYIADELVKIISTSKRKEVCDVYLELLDDDSKAVVQSARESLGRFICAFADSSKTGLSYTNGILVNDSPTEIKTPYIVSSSEPFELWTYDKLIDHETLADFSLQILENDSSSTFDDSEEFSCDITFSEIVPRPSKIFFKFKKNFETFEDSSTVTHSLDNDTCNFNNFLFWRTPLPEIELNLDLDEKDSIVKTSTQDIFQKQNTGFVSCIPDDSVNMNSSAQKSKEDEKNSQDLSSQKNPSLTEELTRMEQIEKNLREDLNRKKIEKKPVRKKEVTIYDQDIVPPELVLEFERNVDFQEMRKNLAYYFPSLVYTLGRKYWPCIRGLFDRLATDFEIEVRSTIASSLHELAFMLGQDTTTKELLPIFLDYLKDDSILSNSSIIINIPSFLKEVKPSARRVFLKHILEIPCHAEEHNWRYRLTVLEKLIPCVQLFTFYDAIHFLPLPLLLMKDKTSSVRRCAVELLAEVIKSLEKNPKSLFFLKDLSRALDETFRQSERWFFRQIYVYICQELAVKRSLSKEFYVDEIVPNLFSLAWDFVPNVRLAVARCIGLTLLPLGFMPLIQKAHSQLLEKVIVSLQNDVDRDVRHFVPPIQKAHSQLLQEFTITLQNNMIKD